VNKIFILSMIALIAHSAHAESCLSPEEVRGIRSVYRFVSAGGDEPEISPCDNKSLAGRALQTIAFLNAFPALEIATNLQKSAVMVEGPAAFLQKRISTFVLEAPGSNTCNKTTVAYVGRFEKATMHLCPLLMNSEISIFEFASSLIHEARHTEGFSHVRCTHGALEKMDTDPYSTGACDNTYEEQGSYGIETSFMINVYQGSKNEILRQEARGNAAEYLADRFNRLPLNIVPGAILLDKAGTVSFYDTEKRNFYDLKKIRAIGAADDELVLFEDSGVAKDFYKFAVPMPDAEGLTAISYRDASPQKQASLLDVVYAEEYGCLLFANSIRCTYSDPGQKLQSEEFEIKDFEPKGFFGRFILAQDGSTFHIPTTYEGFLNAGAKGFIKNPSRIQHSSFGYLKNQFTYGISMTGVFESYDAAKKTWSAVPSLRQERFKKIIAPFYWSQKLQDL
jgi:hypothetical protein